MKIKNIFLCKNKGLASVSVLVVFGIIFMLALSLISINTTMIKSLEKNNKRLEDLLLSQNVFSIIDTEIQNIIEEEFSNIALNITEENTTIKDYEIFLKIRSSIYKNNLFKEKLYVNVSNISIWGEEFNDEKNYFVLKTSSLTKIENLKNTAFGVAVHINADERTIKAEKKYYFNISDLKKFSVEENLILGEVAFERIKEKR